MKLTKLILSLPVIFTILIFLGIVTGASKEFAVLFFPWILSGLFCFGWSFHIFHRNRRLGWLCAVIPIIQLIMLGLLVIIGMGMAGEAAFYPG
jgi:ABC-type Na+ efflux pump permease subunit